MLRVTPGEETPEQEGHQRRSVFYDPERDDHHDDDDDETNNLENDREEGRGNAGDGEDGEGEEDVEESGKVQRVRGGGDGKRDGETKKRRNKEKRRKCVPMADWQVTSYPNCNLGECCFFPPPKREDDCAVV